MTHWWPWPILDALFKPFWFSWSQKHF